MTKFVVEGVERFIKERFKDEYDLALVLIVGMLKTELREEYQKEAKNEG
jgi:hypothetical protein